VWGLVELEKRRPMSSGAGFGVGASAKLFPIFLLPAAVLERLSEDDRRGAARLVMAAVGVAALINIPWLAVAPKNWFDIWRFQAARPPNIDSLWFWVAEHGHALAPSGSWHGDAFRSAAGGLGTFGFLAGGALYLWLGWRRRDAHGYPLVATSLGILVLFLLLSKNSSPQYALWILPLLTMLDVPWPLVAAYLIGDLAVSSVGFFWITVFGAPASRGLFEAAVLIRAVSLIGLAWWATRAVRLQPPPMSA
jgi:uncharacterized membrane protein